VFGQTINKPKVAVMNFDVVGMDPSASILLTDRFRAELYKTNRYEVMERAKMEELLKEQAFQISGACNSNECVIQVGKILGTTQMVAGSVGQIGQMYSISVRIVDVETGRILGNETEDCMCPVEKVMTESMKNIARKLVGLEPDQGTQQQINSKAPVVTNERVNRTDECIDIEGNVYETVKIGNQVWMAENLSVTHYRTGEPVLEVTDNGQWMSMKNGAYSNYINDMSSVTVCGRLYNWFAVIDKRNIAPIGWHIPTDEEWKQLEIYLGMSNSDVDGAAEQRGTNEGGKLKAVGTRQWHSPNVNASDESGFAGLPCGYRGMYDGTINNIGISAHCWSSTQSDEDTAWSRALYYDRAFINRRPVHKASGLSVRCVKD